MVRTWIAYLLGLCAGGIFFICFSDWFSLFLLSALVVLPFFSLAVSLPGMLGCRLGVRALRPAVRRGDKGNWELWVESRRRLSLGQVRVELELSNALTGERKILSRSFCGCSQGLSDAVEMDTRHCGVLWARVRKARVYDLLGLFSLRREGAEEAQVLVLPQALEAEAIPALGDLGRAPSMRVKPGGGPGEDYELRPYRPGDPMRSVHWKLSSKLSELVVRETLEEVKRVVVLTYDHFGTPEELDGVFDRLDAASRWLISRQQEHYICSLGPEGEERRYFVDSIRALREAQWEFFAMAAPAAGSSILERPLSLEHEGELRRLHLSSQGEGAAS